MANQSNGACLALRHCWRPLWTDDGRDPVASGPVQSKSRAHRSRPVRFSPQCSRRPTPSRRHVRAWRKWRRSDNGSVAIEFAFVASILVVLIMNVLDFSRLIWAQGKSLRGANGGAGGLQDCSRGPAGHDNCSTQQQGHHAIQSTSLGTA